jgi:hypothetical protein
MPDIQITNNLPFDVGVYDSYSGSDNKSASAPAYYGNLTSMGTVSANAKATMSLKHEYADALIVFDAKNTPIARYAWSMLTTDTPAPFVIAQQDVSAMQQSEAFVKYIVQNQSSDLTKSFMAAKDKGPDAVDAFFQTSSDYKLCTYSTYMLALTYEAQTPQSVALPPPQKQYSLSKLVQSIGGIHYPAGLPDIQVSNFSCQFNSGYIIFGATVDLKEMPFKNAQIGNNILSLFPVTHVDVQVDFCVQLGANVLGTEIVFLANDFNIPVGNGKSVKIKQPTVKLDITPVFKFVVFTASAVIPFNIFGQKFDAKISMLIDNIEAEIGAVVDDLNGPLITPPVMKGIHLDEFGVGMGIIFEPPGYAIGLQGKFHIGDGNQVVALDDDTFALVCELEGDVPNPVYLSFYVPKLDIATLVAVFTNAKLGIDFPVDFEELCFVWNEDPMEPVALPDGTLSQGGYGFSGFMNLFGLKFYVNFVLNLSEIKGQGVLAPFNLAGLLKVEGDAPAVTVKVDASGNIIRNNTITKTQAEKAAIAKAQTKTLIPAGGAELAVDSGSSPWFKATAKVSFLGLVREEIEACVDKNGISFELDYGSVLSSKFKCVLQNFDNFSGSFSYGPDFDVSLPSLFGFSLGTIHIHDTIGASLALKVSSSNVILSCSGGFNFQGLACSFGPFSLDINISKITDVLSQIEHQIIADAGQIFAAFIKDAEKWASWVKNQVVAGVEDVVGGLKTAYQKTYEEAADVLHAVGYDANFIAQGLKGVYNLSSEAIAGVLKGYGYTIAGISTALKYAGYGASAVASAFEQLKYPAEDVALALSDAFSLAPDAVNSVMQGVGYSVDVIESAFNSIGGAFSDFATKTWDAVSHDLNPSHW